MKSVWMCIDKKPWRAETKYLTASLILGLLFAGCGYILWLIVRIWALSALSWMICFTGYPAVFAWVYVFFYSSRHDFHSGSSNALTSEKQKINAPRRSTGK